ncbi:MAG: molybdenum cofactor biosynthesis protein MoaE [Candidatus Kapaibacterium sp.]|nr:MAG: molybdenum cofactor biosynthesis protein MoaE [Candidatus Kapabacteria bacterium]
MNSIHLSETPLNVPQIIASVQDNSCGAVNIFVGTVRNTTASKAVLRLDFEAYFAMALREMEQIANELQTRWNAAAVAIHHRTGSVEVGGIAVVIAVATPHRKASFEACEYAIGTLKTTVPIWKKEIFEDGEVWVTPHA